MIPEFILSPFKNMWTGFKASGLGVKVAIIVALVLAALFLMWTGASVANAASVVTSDFEDNSSSLRDASVLQFDWTAHTDGSVTSYQHPDAVYGYVALVVVDPGTPAPQASYDITITDESGMDVMGGALADLSATDSLQTMPVIGPSGDEAYAGRLVLGKLTLNISNNNVNGAKGTVYVYIVR